MGNINKGTIASISGNTARVVPSDAGAKPTAKITIPWHLRGSTGNLSKGTAVVYVEFDDSTGLLLGRADGEWGCYLPSLSAGNINVPKGDVTARGISLSGHTHGGVETGSGSTKKTKLRRYSHANNGTVGLKKMGRIIKASRRAGGAGLFLRAGGRRKHQHRGQKDD